MGQENDDRPTWVSNTQLQLEIKAMRSEFEKRFSDVKLWILGAVALNQFLASADLPSSVTGSAFAAVALKGVFAALFKGS